jgi:PIN domain nuclease of toxin-antitoxin system
VRLLLDAHLLLRAAGPLARLSSQARRLIDDPEVAIKYGRGRDDFQVDPRLLRRRLLNNGYRELAVTGEHVVAVVDLPRLHSDPFDRILVAQSIVEGITLLTTDPRVAQYPGPGASRVIPGGGRCPTR